MRRRKLTQNNFSKGMIRDSALDEDRLFSLRTMKNYKVLYQDGRLEVRNGYTRWNSTELIAPATQLLWFADLNDNEHLLAILGDALNSDRWYDVNESGAHTRIEDPVATAPRPIEQFGNRVFFGTDTTWLWTDDTALTGADLSYRVGIVRPSPGILISSTTARGHIDSPDFGEELTTTIGRKLAIQYDVGASDELVQSIHVLVQWFGQPYDGAWTCRIRTDNAGEPSTTLVDDKAISFPEAVANNFSNGSWDYTEFQFKGEITLDANSTVWFEFEGDDDYYDNYKLVAPNQFYGSIGSEGATGNHDFGPIFEWSHAGQTWAASATDGEGIFYLSSLDTTLAYGYVVTFFNSTYGIESRQSEEERQVLTDVTSHFTVSTPTTTDDQVDKVRIYRREMTNIEDVEDDITDTYKLVAEIDKGTAYDDSIGTGYLGGELQTQDHYRYDETDDSGEDIRSTALLPDVAVRWKGRIWFAEASDNNLHFSKILEEDGAPVGKQTGV
ncbi:MAG: hypothetical protein ACYS30_24845 [Planctomycetota bacterium]|jgi:hypothetical protein